ncbi:lipase secretion chaperone [Noviherbaspirillum saxi]|uniref:Lipase chaperone n=1 Tax=Noviherbaspirillum saxi TaxID=2320863 RepID=A0A3A3FU04_9BURK|nr:lipase secretion chaperone [Noviherbaspirillum saxi]RJF99273.1 lipase chaperone [Noviherbaspirillum saxi]
MSRITLKVWHGAAAISAALMLWLALMPREELAPMQASPEPNLFAFVRSLEGTRPDGNLQIDGGDLVVSAELVRMFDYYLAATGEKPLQAIRAEIEHDIDTRLKGRAAEQARQLLTRYVDYKHALLDIDTKPVSGAVGGTAVRQRFAAMQEVRLRFFSQQEIEAMFAMEDAGALDAIARLEIRQDQSLTSEEKQIRLAALDASLAPALRDAREEPMKIVRLEQSIANMRNSGASEDEIYRARAAALNPEAAARLSELDRDEESWNKRIADYRSQRQCILNAAMPLSEANRATALEQLRQSGFTPEEQLRLAAYE